MVVWLENRLELAVAYNGSCQFMAHLVVIDDWFWMLPRGESDGDVGQR